MRTGHKTFLALVLTALLSGVSAIADATTVLYFTRDELVQRSTMVARVTVGKSITQESDDGTAIITRTELKVTQLLKGSGVTTLVVEQFGGTYKGKTQKVSGDGRLKPGEDAVVFLRGDKSMAYFTALAQSVYHVKQGVARRDLDGLSLMQRQNGKIQPVVPVESPEPVEHLMTEVTRIAGGK